MNSIYNKIIIGILSVQGDFLEHQEILKKLGIFSINIRLYRIYLKKYL